MGRNAHKSTFVRGSLPTIFGDEDRRFQQCEQPFIVLASVEDGSMYKNDVTHVFQNVILSGDTVTISIEKNGQVLANRGTSVFYPNSPNAVGFIFDWRQYLQNEGVGCYTIKLECVLAGVNIDFTWGNYELSPWTIDSAMNTVRVYSRFNSYALNHNIDFSGSNAVDSIRFNGFFGGMQPNTKVNNLKANNNVQSKVTRENLKTYELTSDLLNVCHTKRLIDLHFLHENDVWISDHNPQNHTYEYRDIEVIVKEVPDIEYPKDVRGAVVKCVFEDKQPYYKSRYRTSSPISDVTPSPVCSDGTVNVNKSDGTLISAVTVASGGTEPYNVADSTAVLKDTDGTTISTTPIKATENEDIVAPDGTVENSTGSYSDTVVSGGTLVLPDETINIVDEDGNPIDSITFPVYTDPDIDITSYCPVATPPSGRELLKTGQTTSYRTGDDGDLQEGRDVDFFTLDYTNPFGNTNRFTDELGGTTYTNNWVIDWSTYNAVTGKVLGYWKGDFVTTRNWQDSIDWALGTHGTFANCRLANAFDMFNLTNLNTTLWLNYAPFNFNVNQRFWTSSAINSANFYAYFPNGRQISQAGIALLYLAMPVRTFTVTGTTLT